MAQVDIPQSSRESELTGIGGWLVLPPVHLVLNAGIIAYTFVTSFMKGYNEGPTQRAAGAASSVIEKFFSPAMLASFGVALISVWVFLYAVFCLIRFFQKTKNVPKLMIGFYSLIMILALANVLAIERFPELSTNPNDTFDAVMGTVRVGIAIAIWIPYFLVSKRVKNTFVR